MSNGNWYSNKELAKNFGWRFGGRLYQLRKYGVKFEKKEGEGYIEYWRVVNIPITITYKNTDRLKVTKLSLIDRFFNYITK